MSLLDDASLLVTPNAEKEGKLYSIIPTNGNGDFSVTRATTATRTNASGLIESSPINEPRLDYSLGSCPNILLEPQRTNLALNSQSFFPSWSVNPGITNALVTPSTTIDPQGLTNAARVENVTGGTIGRAFTIVSGSTYTSSWYIRRVSGTGAVNLVDVNGNLVPVSITNSWQRFSTSVVSSSTTGRCYVRVSNVGDVIEVWGAQLEAGAYATSYIPTTSASVTRNADVISRGNIFTNGLITASGGTWFVDLSNNLSLVRDVYSTGLFVGDTTGAANSLAIRNAGGTANRLAIQKFIASIPTTLFTTTTSNVKIAIKWNGATADVFVNGVKVVTATAFTTTAMQFLSHIAPIDVPKNINSMALFPTPLTDTQCIAITS